MPGYDRTPTRTLRLAICFAVLLLWLPVTTRATVPKNADQFQALQKKLIKDGFNSEKITKLYSRPQVFFEADGVTILFTYSEAKVDYNQFANDWSIGKAKKYMAEHRQDLDRVEKTYGVDSRVITAILLVESGLGKNTGKRSTLNSLSTLASLMYPDVRRTFYKQIPAEKRPPKNKFEKSAKRRSNWAYNELKAFLKYAYKEGMDPAEIPGSFAGAMGYAQFMPSSILAYGKDGNGDGTVDLLTHPDAMASIANYLKRHGWKPGISRKKKEKVIYHYNHSEYYVKTILKIAERLKS
ncbi:MAG: lytic murein transglycosylase [Desulfobacterales bacterium]